MGSRNEVMSLDQLRPGQSGKVVNVAGSGAIRRRLSDLGVRRGEIVRMIKSAPLRDPLQISLADSHLSIRRSEASLVSVEIVQDDIGEC